MKTITVLTCLVVCGSGSAKVNRGGRGLRYRGDLMENLFNVYDPSFLSVVWPKIANGVHLNVEHQCWEDLGVFFKDLGDGRAWAYNAVDASGRYHSSLLSGSRFWLGSKQQCLEMNNCFMNMHEKTNNTTADHNENHYNSALHSLKHFESSHSEEWQALIQNDDFAQKTLTADTCPSCRVAYTVAQVMLNVTKVHMAKIHDVIIGLCLPKTCPPEDIAALINFSIMVSDNLKLNSTPPRTVKITSVRPVKLSYNLKSDMGVIMFICVTVLLFVLSITATVIDLDLIRYKIGNSNSMSFDLHKYNTNNADHRCMEDEDNRARVVLPRKEANMVDLETLTINNINNANNINLVTVKKVIKPNAMPPSITLDVVSMERASASCKRCGKYKKQCSSPRPAESLPPCPRAKYNTSMTSLSTDTRKKSNFFTCLLLSFSLNYSWKRIFNSKLANKDLSIIHVLRISSTLWIIFMHVSTIVDYISEDGGKVNDQNNSYYIIATGTLALDTLFFASGLFSAYHYFYLKSQYSVEELVSIGGKCGQILQYVCFVTNRIVRLLPSYAYAILLTSSVAHIYRETSVLTLPESDHHNCDQYWWRNLLYITNIYSKNERCMQISWYLTLETQLHAAGAFLCAVMSGRRAGAAAAIAAAAFLLSTAADVSTAYYEYGQRFSNAFSAYAVIVDRPWARVAPYFIGVLTGWIVHKKDGILNVSRVTSCCLSFATLSTVVASSTIPWVGRAWMSAWLHLSWPAALAWPALVFSTEYAKHTRRLLNCSFMAALSRLSYSMLLTHGVVARALLLSANTALCSHSMCIWSYFAGTTVLTFLSALLLALLVEMPCCSLLRRLCDFANH